MASEPAPAWRVALSDLAYGEEEAEAVARVLRSRWLTMGAGVQAFEDAFAAMCGARHAIAVTNGTAALWMTLRALGVGPGEEVVQPAVNFVATANVTALLGARPVFADIVSLDEPTIDPAEVARLLTPRTRAVVAMHYGGAPARMRELRAVCAEAAARFGRPLALVEDACHAVGGRAVAVEGDQAARGIGTMCGVGTLGDCAAFSFFSNKNLATGEGGMITTDREELAAALRALRSHGMTSLTWDRHRGHAYTYDVTSHGFNARMDELHAALGMTQLEKLPALNARRRALARYYHACFAGQAGAPLRERGWRLPPLGVEGDDAAHHLMIALAPDGEARGRAMARLREHGVQSSIHYPFIPAFTAFQQDAALPAEGDTPSESHGPSLTRSLSRSRAFCERTLTLPLHPLMSEADVETVLAALAAQP